MAPEKVANRPLSPHLFIYKPQLTSVLSILHRMTGMFISLGLVGVVVLFAGAAMGEEAFQYVQYFLTSWLGILLLFAMTLSYFYHLLNGIRHLCWDMGKGFELSAVYMTGWIVVFGTVVFTCVVWFLPERGG